MEATEQSSEGPPSSQASRTNKEVALAATADLLDARDLGAIDKYLGRNLVQHSAFLGDGVEGLREFVSGLPPDFRYERARVLAQGDVVALHGRYHGIGVGPVIAWDLYRVADGLIVEHWDGRQAEVTETASGHSMLDGPTEVTQPGATAANQQLVEPAVHAIFLEADLSALDRYWVADEAYIQHNPRIADTLSGLRNAFARFAEEGTGYAFTRHHRTVADGEFVLTVYEGTSAGDPVIFYDLWRVEGGLIAEHWDVISEIPQALPHQNGVF
jgi:predicted SnoaL-like aldol condensation-catalyzing enzyme